MNYAIKAHPTKHKHERSHVAEYGPALLEISHHVSFPAPLYAVMVISYIYQLHAVHSPHLHRSPPATIPRALCTPSSEKPRHSAPQISAGATKFSQIQPNTGRNRHQQQTSLGLIQRRIHAYTYVKMHCVRTILMAKPVGQFTLFLMLRSG